MDQITEDLNKEMLTDIYNLKKKLKITQMENNDLQIELSRLRLMLLNANSKADDLEKKNVELQTKSDDFEKKYLELEEKHLSLNKKVDDLQDEKSTLKEQYYQQLQLKSQEGIWTSLTSKDLLEEFKADFKLDNSTTNGYRPQQFQFNNNSSFFSHSNNTNNLKKDSSHLTNGANGHSINNDDTNSTTLAMKLKQSQGNFFEQSTQPFSRSKQQLSSPVNGVSASPVKIVVKEPNAAVKNHNTRSLYVAGLYKGLSLAEVRKYFEKFGKILTVTVPPVVDNIVDGQKYLFIKYEECSSVDKILKQDFHTIKDISVRTKPGRNV